MKWLKLNNPRQSKRQKWLQEEHMRTFTHWHGFKGRENPSQKKNRGTTRKSMIIRNRNRGIKLVIKYNADGIYVGESYVHLTSYLGVLARTMVPIRYNTWRDVPEQLKDKLWDSIEGSTKQRRKKHIYNHHLSRKGYLGLEEEMFTLEEGNAKKDGSYDDVVLPVVEKIDELMKESQDNGISYSGSNDILSQALGTPEYLGRVRAKGKHYTGRYFNIVEKPIGKVEEETLIVKIEPHMKARKCELAVGTRENTVAGGTIVMDCGPNYLVVLDAPYESNAPLPIPIPGQATTVGAAVGYQVLWPTHLVNLSTKFIKGSHKGKRQKTTENDLKIGENPQDINNFDALVGLMLNEGKHKVWSFHWVLVALDMRTMTAYYLDPMQKQPCDDLKEIVNMALRIHPPEKQRSSKREPTWVKVVCPRQLGSVEYGYYVMRYMKDIIVDPSLLSTKFKGKKSYSEVELNEVRSEWVMLATQLILTHA
ncbi:hypothetical protein AAG906_001767 [Vitis piasezkii]